MIFTDPSMLLLLALLLQSIGLQITEMLKLSFVNSMIILPIFFLMNISSVSIFLVLLLYRVVIKLLVYEMHRFLTAALENTALSRLRSRRRDLSSGMSVMGCSLSSSSRCEGSKDEALLKEGSEIEEEHGHPEEVYILGEAFFRVSNLSDALTVTD